MTEQYMNKMTEQEIKDFDKKCSKFDESQSVEDYTTDIRDTIYLWRAKEEKRESYSLASISKRLDLEKAAIERFFEEKEPVAYAAIDIDYTCG